MYFDDFVVGQVYQLEPVTFTEREIIDFAALYDPLPIHIDPDFAGEMVFGGIIASGFHTLAAVQRKWIDLGLVSRHVIGGLGIDFLHWHAPVRPGDTLSATVEVVEKTPSSKGPRGVIGYRFTVKNQEETTVLTHQVKALFKRRP